MKITYSPTGGEPQEFLFDADEFSAVEAELIEEAGGVQWDSFAQWVYLLERGNFRAWRVALWVLMRRTNPELGLNEVQPAVKEVLFDIPGPDDAEGEPGKDEPADSPTDST